MLLAVLGLLQGGIWLQDDPVHSAAQGVVRSLGEGVHNRGWSHCMLLLLLPRLCHPSTSHVGIQSSADEGAVGAQLREGGRGLRKKATSTLESSRVLQLRLHTSFEMGEKP